MGAHYLRLGVNIDHNATIWNVREQRLAEGIVVDALAVVNGRAATVECNDPGALIIVARDFRISPTPSSTR